MVSVQGSTEFVLNILMARKEFESPYDCCGRCFVAFLGGKGSILAGGREEKYREGGLEELEREEGCFLTYLLE